MGPIEFALTEKDFYDLQRVVSRRVRKHVGTLTLPFFGRVLAWMFLAIPMFTAFRLWREGAETTGSLPYLVASFVLAFLLGALVVPWASQRLLVRYALSDQGTFFAKQRISLRSDGFEVTTGSAEVRMQWSTIVGRDQDERNFYLFVDALQALVVPQAVADALGPEFKSNLERVHNEA